MPILDTLSFSETDPRVRRSLYPRRVVLCHGGIEGADSLLQEKNLQITTNEPDVAVMDTTDGPAELLLDFGIEFHGGARLLTGVVEGGRYPQMRLCFGESVSEALSDIGEKNAGNDHSPRDITVTLSSWSDLEFGETGYRFLRLQLLTPGIRLQLKAVTGMFIYRDLPYLGGFQCDDARLNQIYDTAAYTCHLNMQKRLWDGIKRDRLVWVGDMHPEALTIRTIFGPLPMLEDTIRFARESTPLPEFMNGMPTYSLWWIRIVYDWYLYTGSKSFLEENREYVRGLVPLVMAWIGEDGSDQIPDYFLDWPTKDTPAAVDGARGLMAYALEGAENLCRLYGEIELADICDQRREALRHAPACHHGAKQTAAMLVLSGILAPDEARDALLSGGAQGMSTFMSYYILKAAAEGGEMSPVLEMLKEYYGGMLDMGATTFWEDFDVRWLVNAAPITEPVPEGKSDIHGDNGAYCYSGFRHSLCHGWASGPVPFLCEEVLGVRLLEPGCKKIGLKPRLGYLKWAEGTFPTPYGVLQIRHEQRSDGTINTVWKSPESVEVVLL